MNSYMIGSTVRLKMAFTNNGAAIIPASPPTVTVRAPDGSSASPVVVDEGGGQYHADYTPTVGGAFSWYAVGSAFPGLPASAAVAAESTFFIQLSRTITP